MLAQALASVIGLLYVVRVEGSTKALLSSSGFSVEKRLGPYPVGPTGEPPLGAG